MIGDRVIRDFDLHYERGGNSDDLMLPCELSEADSGWLWTNGPWVGTIVDINEATQYVMVKYEDGDEEELDTHEVVHSYYPVCDGILLYFHLFFLSL